VLEEKHAIKKEDHSELAEKSANYSNLPVSQGRDVET
jgi:hypothetical protein